MRARKGAELLSKGGVDQQSLLDTMTTALLNSDIRTSMYHESRGIFMFDNPCFGGDRSASMDGSNTSKMRLRDFLASIPSFSDFTDQQLITLEQKATVRDYKTGDIIFRQGEKGDAFFVIHKGAVDILVQDNQQLLRKGDLGRVVNRLKEGCFFGERALMTAELRAASIKSIQDTTCLVFSRSVYEEVISGSSALIGKDVDDNVDWSKDHETRSLFRHVESVLEIDSKDTSPQIKRVLYELSTAFTPELSADEVISRMVMTVKTALRADRVGLFVLSEDKRSMVLKVSERGKGVRLPVRGLAGAVIQQNEAMNIADAYLDPRFDATMDRRTGYRTRQVLGVPLRHPVTGTCVGLLQVNNKTDGSFDPFTSEQQKVLELAAEQLSELSHGRTDVFINSGAVSGGKGFGQGSVDGAQIITSSELTVPFQIQFSGITLSSSDMEIIEKEGIVQLVVTVSLHLALGQLCSDRCIVRDLQLTTGIISSKSSKTMTSNDESSSPIQPLYVRFQDDIFFDINVNDLPRATRILFRVAGKKKKPKTAALVPLGWTASTIFDFKACLETTLDLKMFSGDNLIPVNTTLSNAHCKDASSLVAVLAADIVTGVSMNGNYGSSSGARFTGAGSVRNKIVYGMASSGALDVGDAQNNAIAAEAHKEEFNRILLLSFNPLSSSLMTEADKDFLWDLRYSILDRAELLPSFVMSVQWHRTERVQELYDLLDIWRIPTPVQALQLLDRRFMDPKVRAYAVHCLEDLTDEELALYMLQLCQQLKFESHVDSALSRFLLRRALTNRRVIGHIFFWLLQSEVYNLDVKRRFTILLQIYISNCGHHRVELGQQMFVMKRLEHVAALVVEGESKQERLQILREKLSAVVFPPEYQLPLNPHVKVRGIDISRCRVMESKKKPLWLTLKDAPTGGNDIVLMLKVGDDLRQDALVMQLLRVMSQLWRREGLDMQMMLYDCISTGYERGLLQVVLNATTLGHILLDATDKQATNGKSKGGSLSRKITSAFKALTDFNVMKRWIEAQVIEDLGSVDEETFSEEMDKRTQHFIISTAAYCVASYVLGLGDRHNDNLMITRDAHFFHIDFGHILGNFKSKMGVKRERAPFVFTPAMKAVMNAEQYEAFVDLCCDVYNILRENATLLVSLVSLAIPCNLPELREEKDVMWMYDKLMVGATEEQASAHFREVLNISLNTRGTRLNDAAHMLAHA